MAVIQSKIEPHASILLSKANPTFRVKSSGFRLEKKAMDLKIKNPGKDFFIEQLQKQLREFSINC
jgi:hypothetical protein